jgi:hypothetical protein
VRVFERDPRSTASRRRIEQQAQRIARIGGCCALPGSLSQVAMRVVAIAGLVFGVAPDASLNRLRGSHWHCKASTSIAEEEAAKLDNPTDFAGLSADS